MDGNSWANKLKLKIMRLMYGPLVDKDGYYIGRRSSYGEWYKIDVKKDITAYEVGLWMQALYPGGASPEFLDTLPKPMRRHFKTMTKGEFDKQHNPEMEIDQEAGRHE